MSTRWWGKFTFEPGHLRHWQVGTFAMWITRLPREVRLVTRSMPEDAPTRLIPGTVATEALPEDGEVTRFGVPQSGSTLEVLPRTADRAFIFKSQNTFMVPPGGEVKAFMSSPIWVGLQLTGPVRPLHEVATYRPSDTWFGPSTLEGELAYAARTSVRFNLENVPVEPSRAVTVVRIVNQAATALPLARLRLPLPQLSLYADGVDRLWTESVILNRRHDGDFAEIKLTRKPPEEAGSCHKIGPPREELGRHSLIRSFTSLLGLSGGQG